MTTANQCLDCVRKENAMALKDRDLKDLNDDRDYYRQQLEAARQQLQAAQQEVAKLQQQHPGHATLEEHASCPNCGPKSNDERAKVAAKLLKDANPGSAGVLVDLRG